MKGIVKSSIISLLIVALVAGVYFVYGQKADKQTEGKTEDFTKLSLETKEIITNLKSEQFVKTKFLIEFHSKEIKERAEEILPVIESDVIKLLANSKKEEMKSIESLEKTIEINIENHLGKDSVAKVYTTELLVQ